MGGYEKMKSKKILGILLLLSIVVGLFWILNSMLPKSQAMVLQVGIALAILVLWVIGKMITIYRLQKMLSQPNHLLYEDKDPLAYSEEMQKLLPQVDGRQQKDLIAINIAAAQLYAGDYTAVHSWLEQVALPGQPEVNRVLYYVYNGMAYFLNEQKEEGLALVEQERNLFQKYSHTASGITSNILVLYAYEKNANHAFAEALSILEEVEERKVSSILQDLVDYGKLNCYRNLKMEEERAAMKKVLKKAKLVPAIAHKI